ncbi:hypothetical protein PMm318_A56870 [Pseudomonas moorei]
MGGDVYDPKHTATPCGSGLARESDVTINDDAECNGVIAGKPAPTGLSLWLDQA